MYALSRAITAGLALGLAAALATPLSAAPVLKSAILVQSPIVTVADMFDDAGALAETAIFRAPAPGTAGQVSLEMVRQAASRIGLDAFETNGLPAIRVERAGILVDQAMLVDALTTHLSASSALEPGVTVNADFAGQLPLIFAATGGKPVVLDHFQPLGANNGFAARFTIAGQSEPLDLRGRISYTVEAPHLVRSLPSGAVLTADDIELRPVSVRLADAAGVPAYEDIIGLQIQRQMRAGIMLRAADLGEPQVIARNDTVTLYLQQGAMTLTVRGQALNSAGRGDPVSVLNLVSNRVVQGIAVESGTVMIAMPGTAVASL